MIKVLVIDDDRAYLQVLSNVLNDDPDIKVMVCKDSRKAVQQCKDYPPDIILLDLNMPHVNGIEVRTALRDDPETSLLPVIFISAEDDPATIEDVFRVGCFEYLTKPINSEQLRETIKQNRIQNLFNEINAQLSALHLMCSATTPPNFLNAHGSPTVSH